LRNRRFPSRVREAMSDSLTPTDAREPNLSDVALKTISALGTASGEIFDPAGGFDELLRAATGRRNVDQLREMDWDGDVDAVIPSFWWGPLHPSEKRIDE